MDTKRWDFYGVICASRRGRKRQDIVVQSSVSIAGKETGKSIGVARLILSCRKRIRGEGRAEMLSESCPDRLAVEVYSPKMGKGERGFPCQRRKRRSLSQTLSREGGRWTRAHEIMEGGEAVFGAERDSRKKGSSGEKVVGS